MTKTNYFLRKSGVKCKPKTDSSHGEENINGVVTLPDSLIIKSDFNCFGNDGKKNLNFKPP